MPQRTCSFPGCEKPHNCKGYCRGHYAQLKRGVALRPLGFKLSGDIPLADRLAARSTVVASGCREYTGSRNQDGYGTVFHDGKTWLAHRLAYVSHHGQIPDGHVIRHLCDNPPCINPAHLILGKQSDNVNDCIGRDRFARGENVATHKLTDAECDQIRQLYSEGVGIATLVRKFPQVRRNQIYRVAAGSRRANPTNRGHVA